MFTAVTETAKLIHPISVSISNGIMNSISKILNIAINKNHDKAVKDISYALKLEYPHETDEYVHHLALQAYEESKR